MIGNKYPKEGQLSCGKESLILSLLQVKNGLFYLQYYLQQKFIMFTVEYGIFYVTILGISQRELFSVLPFL